jgi:hypothetical protein
VKKSPWCSLPRWAFTLGGLALAVVAVAAYPLGLDSDPAMGVRRLALLALGIGVVLLAQAGAIRTRLGIRAAQDEPLDSTPRPMGLGHWLPLSLVAFAILAFYAWLVTSGDPAHPPSTTLYYDMLAEAFAAGQTHLTAVPDPRLAALDNPYDPAENSRLPRCREGQTSGCLLFDATYYDGKYYLYWGPAPAALLAPLKLVGVGAVSDAALSFLGAASLFLLTASFLVQAWRRFFAALPPWLMAPPLILAGLAYPLPWVLDGPRIYEAAILWGAAFLMAGLVAAFPVLVGEPARPGRLALAGALWGLAFASRAVLLLPIAAFTIILIWRIARSSVPASAGRMAAALVIPLVAAAALIAWYNFDRFSNPLEFGYRFSLGPPAGQAEGSLSAFRAASVPVNLYNYALAPAEFIGEPPYLRPLLAARSIGALALPRPELFSGELVTGLLFTTPFLLFAGVLLWWPGCGSPSSRAGVSAEPAARKAMWLRRMAALLGIAVVAGLVPLLSIYVVTARYLLDVSPLLLLMAGMGAWLAFEQRPTRRNRAWIAAATTIAAAFSALVSILLTFNNWLR